MLSDCSRFSETCLCNSKCVCQVMQSILVYGGHLGIVFDPRITKYGSVKYKNLCLMSFDCESTGQMYM